MNDSSESGECFVWGKYSPTTPSTSAAPAASGEHGPCLVEASSSARDTRGHADVLMEEKMGVLVWRPADGAALVQVPAYN